MITVRKSLLVATLSLATISSHQLHGMLLSNAQVTNVSQYFRDNAQNPQNVLIAIDQMQKRYDSYWVKCFATSAILSNAFARSGAETNCYLHEIRDENGTNLLQYVCGNEPCSPKIIQEILDASDHADRQNVNVGWQLMSWITPDNDWATSAWHMAVESGRIDVVRVFVNFFTLPNHKNWNLKTLLALKDKRGRTAFHIAAEIGNLPIFNYLIQIGSNRVGSDYWKRRADAREVWEILKERDNQGRTAFHIAAISGHTDIFRSFLRYAEQIRCGLAWEVLQQRDNQGRNLIENAHEICGDERGQNIHDIIQRYYIEFTFNQERVF